MDKFKKSSFERFSHEMINLPSNNSNEMQNVPEQYFLALLALHAVQLDDIIGHLDQWLFDVVVVVELLFEFLGLIVAVHHEHSV